MCLPACADDSAAEEPAAAKPTRAGVKRGRSAAKHAGTALFRTNAQSSCKRFVCENYQPLSVTNGTASAAWLTQNSVCRANSRGVLKALVTYGYASYRQCDS